MKNSKGISLVVLIITIIVMVILAGVTVANIVIDNGIIEKAIKVKDETQKNEIIERIKTEYFALKKSEENKEKSNKEIFETLKEKLNLSTEFIGSESMIIEIIEDEHITLLEDGTIIEGKKILLNIADGNIDLKEKGFIQNNSELIEYTGDYIISGTTTEYCVRIMEEGNYNVTIKNLNIDFASKSDSCPLNLNGANKIKNLNVNLNIEGDNYLYGGQRAAGIGFAKATPNINGVVDGSTLTIGGNGSLYAQGGNFAAGIGSGYSYLGGNVANIIINSGNITAVAGGNGCGIGGGFYANVSNIVINGGNIIAKTSNRRGIGATGILDNLIINGGNITAIGGEYGGAIGGSQGSGEIIINGGEINLENNSNHCHDDATLGDGTNSVKILGGNIRAHSKMGIGIGNYSTLPFKLDMKGGTVKVEDRTSSTSTTLSNGILYLAKFKIGELAKETKITKVETNNNVEYEANELYTTRDGHLFMLLPEGEVTVSVTANNVTYRGTVLITPENTEIFKLN